VPASQTVREMALGVLKQHQSCRVRGGGQATEAAYSATVHETAKRKKMIVVVVIYSSNKKYDHMDT
jgi:hypothetical protein